MDTRGTPRIGVESPDPGETSFEEGTPKVRVSVFTGISDLTDTTDRGSPLSSRTEKVS